MATIRRMAAVKMKGTLLISFLKTGSQTVAQAGLKLSVMLLAQPPECCHHQPLYVSLLLTMDLDFLQHEAENHSHQSHCHKGKTHLEISSTQNKENPQTDGSLRPAKYKLHT